MSGGVKYLLMIIVQFQVCNCAYLEWLADGPILAPDSQRFLNDLSSISFNTSEATGWVSLGALGLLMGATGLYLFNYYSQTARSDSVPSYDPYGNYDPNFHYRR